MLAQLYKFLVALWNEEKKGTGLKMYDSFQSFSSFHVIRGQAKEKREELN